MKFLATALLLFSARAFAEPTCSSVWVYKPYVSCAIPANGLDLSQPGVGGRFQREWSAWLPGGRNQNDVCMEIRDRFNKDNLTEGLHADLAGPKPLGEETENRLVIQEYRYQCRLTVLKFPFKSAPNPACGSEDHYAYKIGGSAAEVPGQASCLSCDQVTDQAPDVIVNCLRQNITDIIEPKAVELRSSDIESVSNRVVQVLNLSKLIPIKNLTSTEQLSFFADFLQKYPPTQNQNGTSGGMKQQPSLQ
jgi:hypothetical protein